MKKTYNVDKKYNNMRIDRCIRNIFGKIPQSLIEKNLRNGKVKLNKKKLKVQKKLKLMILSMFLILIIKKKKYKKK